MSIEAQKNFPKGVGNFFNEKGCFIRQHFNFDDDSVFFTIIDGAHYPDLKQIKFLTINSSGQTNIINKAGNTTFLGSFRFADEHLTHWKFVKSEKCSSNNLICDVENGLLKCSYLLPVEMSFVEKNLECILEYALK